MHGKFLFHWTNSLGMLQYLLACSKFLVRVTGAEHQWQTEGRKHGVLGTLYGEIHFTGLITARTIFRTTKHMYCIKSNAGGLYQEQQGDFRSVSKVP